MDEFPRYIVEYLIDNYCSEETFHEDMEKVVRRLKENFAHGAESDKIRHYIKANHAALGITAEWRENYDVAVLATFMGVPKEGPSAGITIVTGIVSALTNRPVRNDVAMTGEITIMGKVLPVGGIHAKIRAAYEAGVKEVILPADNMKDTTDLPQYVKDAVMLFPVSSLHLAAGLGNGPVTVKERGRARGRIGAALRKRNAEAA